MPACADCQHFTTDNIGFGQGIGHCSVLEAYKVKISDKDKRTQDRLIAAANRQLDCHKIPRWPLVERNCRKFEANQKS